MGAAQKPPLNNMASGRSMQAEWLCCADTEDCRIAADEYRHYKLFYDHMRRYLTRERLDFLARLRVDHVGSLEAYGLAWILPWSGYVKVGRFVPVFGWKFDDHNMFNREELWFDEPPVSALQVEDRTNVVVFNTLSKRSSMTAAAWNTPRMAGQFSLWNVSIYLTNWCSLVRSIAAKWMLAPEASSDSTAAIFRPMELAGSISFHSERGGRGVRPIRIKRRAPCCTIQCAT